METMLSINGTKPFSFMVKSLLSNLELVCVGTEFIMRDAKGFSLYKVRLVNGRRRIITLVTSQKF